MPYSNLMGLLAEIRNLTEAHVEGLREVTADQLGLDPRCGTVWVDTDYIVAHKGSRIEYYGGFEYIEGDNRDEFGDYVVYYATSDRVQDCLECLMEADGECTSDGQPTEQEEWHSFDPDC